MNNYTVATCQVGTECNKKFRKTTSLKSEVPPSLVRAISQETAKSIPRSERRDALSCIPSSIAMTRPRKVMRVSVCLTLAAFIVTTLSMGTILSFILRTWWICIISWVCALCCFVTAYVACRRGVPQQILIMAIFNLAGVCCGIATTCLTMTSIHTAVLISNVCNGGVANAPEVYESVGDCGAYDSNSLQYYAYISSNKGLLTALVVLYGATSVVLDGVAMIYAFFLYRRARNKPRNWLTNTHKSGYRTGTSNKTPV